jgi:hypothetical protein
MDYEVTWVVIVNSYHRSLVNRKGFYMLLLLCNPKSRGQMIRCRYCQGDIISVAEPRNLDSLDDVSNINPHYLSSRLLIFTRYLVRTRG